MTNEPRYSSTMRAHEARLGRPLRDVLVEMYVTMSLAEIAVEFDTGPSTILRWFRVLGIPTMTPRQRRLAAAA